MVLADIDACAWRKGDGANGDACLLRDPRVVDKSCLAEYLAEYCRSAVVQYVEQDCVSLAGVKQTVFTSEHLC